MARITSPGSANAVTTTNAVSALSTVGTASQLILINYNSASARVFFSANNDLVLEDEVSIGLTSEHSSPLERGVLVEGGTAVRVSLTPRSVDTTATNNTVDVYYEVLHTNVDRPTIDVVNENVTDNATGTI